MPEFRPLELTNATIAEFPWWLWVPTIGRDVDKIIGGGIRRVALMQTWSRTGSRSDWNGARFLIVHTDRTAVLLDAAHGGMARRSYSCVDLEVDSRDYNWWVNWKCWSVSGVPVWANQRCF